MLKATFKYAMCINERKWLCKYLAAVLCTLAEPCPVPSALPVVTAVAVWGRVASPRGGRVASAGVGVGWAGNGFPEDLH